MIGMHWDAAKRKQVRDLIERGIITADICRIADVTRNSVVDEKRRMTPRHKLDAIYSLQGRPIK